MTTKANFLCPEFDANIPNKIHDYVEVKSQRVLSINDAPEWHSCIATSGFASKIDGIYVFATKIVSIGGANLIVAFTDVKTYDSKKYGFPGENPQFTGTGLYCSHGTRCSCWVRYLPDIITKTAKEIISILTISNNGGKKEIQWIVDGNEGDVVDCTNNFGGGDEIFPCISFGSNGQQVELIPFDQVKSRSLKIDELMKEYSASRSRAAVMSIHHDQSSSTVLAQLQQELEKEKQHANFLEAQLRQKDQQLQEKDQQLHDEKQNSASKDAEIKRLRQLLNPSC